MPESLYWTGYLNKQFQMFIPSGRFENMPRQFFDNIIHNSINSKIISFRGSNRISNIIRLMLRT